MSTACAQVNGCAVAPQTYCIPEGSARNGAVGFNQLAEGVLLTGVPTVTEQGSSDLTISQVAVNSSPVVIDRYTYEAGQAVVFHVSGGVASFHYKLKVTATTDAAPADVIVGYVMLEVGP